ncbi:unnamed protein product [Adineta ricciae]|uniref:Uncharacterized protein n=1 Tax=Adineta ricciae TaxID=249248 RepID=A0A813N4Z1_ADIRI|nr:unnamed protein product [Adineta ricciae]
MACNISKYSNGSSNISASSVKSGLSFGYLTLGFSGSGLLVNIFSTDNGNAATESAPILKSDISEQL